MKQVAVLATISVLLALLKATSSQTCVSIAMQAPPDVEFVPNIPACKTGEELYFEKENTKSVHHQVCCSTPTPGGDDLYDYYIRALNDCVNTTCVSKSKASGNICQTDLYSVKYVNRSPLKYVETVRDECVDENGEPGIAALCCLPDSMDIPLTTLVGTEPEEFPFFTRIGNWNCGGTVYNERWIITAAHCVVDEEKKRILSYELDGKKDGGRVWYDHVGTIRINIYMRDIPTDRTYHPEEIHVFPNSSWTQPDAPAGSSWGDVALIKLKEKIEFGDKIKALKLVDSGFNALDYNKRGYVIGFGLTDTLRNPRKMQKANMIIHRKDEVPRILPSEHEQLLFAGGIMNDIVSPNFGKGDSGGPFVCRDSNGLAALCGVVSFAAWPTDSCLKNLNSLTCPPSSFNDMGYFHDWIVETAGTQDNVEFWEPSVYGKDVGRSEYPAHVHITNSDGESCGGTLVADDMVLTAASCVVKEDGNYKDGLKVVVGVTDLKKGGGKTIGIKTVAAMGPLTEVPRPAWGGASRRKRMVTLTYESWKAGKWSNEKIQKDPYYKDNLALVKLQSKSGKKPAKLWSQTFHTGDTAMEVAYRTESLGTESRGSLPLQKREFKMLDRKECQKRMDKLSQVPYDVDIEENEICGVEKYTGGSLCDRELGGGLYCKGSGGQEELCGVQIFRLCEFSIPNEFLDLTNYRIKNWLDAAMKQLKNA